MSIFRTISRALRRYRRPVFVIGTGRSGTHWLGRILASHPSFRVTIEEDPHFERATRMATHPEERDHLLDDHIRGYRKERIRSVPLRYADKSHPNLWIADELGARIPGALFLGISRNPYAVVASMLRHEGVLAWIENWEELPLPSPFLGIGSGEAEHYRRLSLAGKCARRWKSHQDRMSQVVLALGARVHVASYEALILQTERELALLQQRLDAGRPFPNPRVKESSLDRWRPELTEQQRRAVAEVVGFGPDEVDRMIVPGRGRQLGAIS